MFLWDATGSSDYLLVLVYYLMTLDGHVSSLQLTAKPLKRGKYTGFWQRAQKQAHDLQKYAADERH